MLLISVLPSVKMTEIICLWERWQQSIVHMSSKSGFFLVFYGATKISIAHPEILSEGKDTGKNV